MTDYVSEDGMYGWLNDKLNTDLKSALDQATEQLIKHDTDKVDRVYAEIETMTIPEMVSLAKKMNELVNNLAESSCKCGQSLTKESV